MRSNTSRYGRIERRGLLAGDLVQISSLGGGGPTIECELLIDW